MANPPIITGQTGSTTTEYDPLMMSTLTDLLNAARREANVPYAAYQGQRIAGFTPEELQSFNAISGMQGVNQPLFNQANQMTSQAAAGLGSLSGMDRFTPEMIQQYMNPYTQQVVDSTAANALRNAQLERNKLRSQAGMTGAFGGDRMAIAEQELLSNTNRNINDVTGQLYSQGFNTSLDQLNRDRQYGLDRLKPVIEFGTQLSRLGEANQAYGLKDAEALNNVGNIRRNMAQTSLDTAYQDWANERDYNKGQINYLSSVLNGTNLNNFATGQSTVTQNQYPKPSTFNSILGGLSTGLGFLSNSGFFGNNTQAKARGGLVKSYAKGGKVSAKELRKGLKDLSEGFYDNAPSEMTDEEALMRGIRKRFGERGYAKGGIPEESRAEYIRRRLGAYKDALTETDVGQALYDSPLGYLTNPMTKIPHTLGNIAQGVDNWLSAPAFSQMPPELAATNRAVSGSPTPIPEVLPEPVGVEDTSFQEVISGLTTDTGGGVMASAPVGVTPEAAMATQAPQAPNDISLADLFTYQDSPMDRMFEPNPLLMMGLGLLGASGNPNDAGWQFSSGVGSALEKYEEMKQNRRKADTEKGSAMGTLLINNKNVDLDSAYKSGSLEETMRSNRANEAIRAAQVDAVRQAAILRAGNGGRVKPSDVTAARNALLRAQAQLNTIQPGMPGYARVKLEFEQAKTFLEQLQGLQLDLSGDSGAFNSGVFTDTVE